MMAFQDFLQEYITKNSLIPGPWAEAEAKAAYLNEGGAAAYNELKSELPQAYVERTPEALAGYRSAFDEHVQYGRHTEADWGAFQDYYMGTPETPQAGTWTNVEGELRFQPTGASGQYVDRGNWLTNLTSSLPQLAAGVLNPIGTTYENLRTAHGIGDVVDAAFDPITGPGITSVSRSIGAAVKDEPGLQSGINAVGDIATGILGVVYGPGGAAAAQGIKGKILGTSNEENLLNAAKAAVLTEAATGLGDVAGDALGGGLTGDLYEQAALLDQGIELTGGIESGGGQALTGIPDVEPGIWSAIKDYAKPVTDLLPDNTGEYLDTGLNVANAILGPGGIQGEDLPPLPGLLTADAPPDALPPLPDLESIGMPEGLTFPDIQPYLPKNWDSMSDAEKESWLITRGGEISKRRRGTWAGNLEGIRGGGTTDLKYAELVGLTGGKSILGE